jgi:hypothetical protein
MTPTKTVRRLARPLLCAAAALLIVTGLPDVASAAPSAPTHKIGTNAILGQVARPTGSAIQPLHRLTGSVQANPRKLSAAAVTAPGVGLRALVIGVDTSDWGVATWTSTLDRVGAAYDVLYSRTTDLTAASLLRSGGNGKYNAILLTSSSQLYDAGGGSFVSGFTADEWTTLWSYETTYGVRQAALYTSYGTWPEDYCLSASSEGGVTEPPLTASLTTAGASIFDYLNPAAAIPVEQSYVYRTRITAGCTANPVLVSGSDVLAVQSTSSDGRQRLALTFTSNQNLNQAYLLVYGMLRWASRGMFLGDQRHYLNVDVDDWFNVSEERLTDGTINSDPGYQMSGHDAYNSYTQETSIRSTYPLASGFTYNMAFNGDGGDETAPSLCSPNSTSPDTLSGTTKCLKNNFHWLNHTFSHLALNFTDYATTYSEINNNRVTANQFGLSQPNTVLKTGEYSGLGVYNPDPNDDVDPPTDHGLGASNPNLLSAAQTLGVRYLHGNMSFPSEVPSCFNCNIVHPLNNALSVVPDWPTNIAYFSTNPDEETSFYNAVYGPGGTLPYFPTNQTYAQVVSNEANIGFSHVATGSVYTHTFHIANLRDYGSGSTLASDWVRAVAGTYSSYYNVPLLNTVWTSLADYTKQRNAHFKARTDGIDAVYFPGTNTINVTAPAGIQETVMLTGTTATGSTAYGTDHLATLTVNGGRTVTVPASPRP